MPKKQVRQVAEVSRVPRAKSEPQTMEELLTQTGFTVKGFKRGERIEGKIREISSRAVFVDIDGKSEGVVAGREYDYVRDYVKTLKVGDKVSLRVVVPEDESGQILLSLRQSAQISLWDKLNKAKENDEEFEVLGKEVTRGGLLVDAGGMTGFVPSSQIASLWQTRLKDLVGRKFLVKIIDLDQATGRLVLSEKLISEKAKIEKLKKELTKIKIGQVSQGEVTAIFPFGIFVKIRLGKGEFEGLVHISEISWEKVEDLERIFQVGQDIKVKIIGIDPEAGRLSLSCKQLSLDPWIKLVEKYKPETMVKGKVTRLAAFGAVVEIEPGVEGLVHISKIPLEAKIDIGDRVDCFIEAIEPEKRRLSLGLVLKGKPVGYK